MLTQRQSDEVLNFVWTHFRENRKWPSRKDFLLRLQRDGISEEEALQSGKLCRTWGGDEEVHPRFEALVGMAEVRDLFGPLPAVLRDAAKRYITHPSFNEDTERPTLHFRDLRSHWSDPDHARLAAEIMRSTDFWPITLGGSSGSDPDDFWFQLQIHVIRFEHVGSLDDVLRVPQHEPKTEVGQYPSGKHLALLQRIHAFSGEHQQWPVAVRFAIDVREIGYVPELVVDLSPRFIRGGFGSHHTNRLELTPAALPFVDSSGEDRQLFVAIVRAIVDIWMSRPGRVEISLSDVAMKLSRTAERLGPVAALLQSPWCHTTHAHREEHSDLVFSPTDPEQVLRNKDLASLEQYLELWGRDGPLHAIRATLDAGIAENTPNPGEAPISLPPVQVRFLKDDRLRRLIEDDLDELRRGLGVKAWKSALILMGSIVEGALLDVLSRREDLAESVLPKGGFGKASLCDLIEGAVKLDLLQPSVRPFAEVVKGYRDLVHPYRATASPLRPNVSSVRAMVHALELVLTDLESASRDGRISDFESK